MMRLLCLLGIGLACLALGQGAGAQRLAWQDVFAHPRNPAYGPPNSTGITGTVLFSDGFVATCLGYAYDNPLYLLQRNTYIRYYDYQGTLLNEDTIGGMVNTSLGTRLSDTSFVVLTGAAYRGPTQTRYDTGQNGGYFLRGYHKSGRLLWQQRRRVGAPTWIFKLSQAGNQRFALVGNFNQDRRGRDSSLIEFYDRQGRYLYEFEWPLDGTANFGFPAMDANPFRFYATRSRRTAQSRWMHEVIVSDSVGQVIRIDPLGESAYSFIGNQALITPLADKGYIADLIYPSTSDSILTHRFYVSASGQIRRYARLEGQYVTSVAAADGGEIQFNLRFPTNLWASYFAMQQAGWPRGRGDYQFRRVDSTGALRWSMDVSYWDTDSIFQDFAPAASIPSSPEDAIIIGRRVVMDYVRSEPAGTEAIVGRINGIGRLYDPTGLRRPESGPRAQGRLTAWPSPTAGPLRYAPPHLPCQVLDGIGRTVAHGTQGAVDISALAPGLYTLRLADGRTVRIVKS